MTASARVTMFGLDVGVPESLDWLRDAGTIATGRRVELAVAAAEDRLDWPGDAAPICDERDEDGGVLFQIARGERGYGFSGPRYGTAIVSPEASRIWGSPGEGGIGDWQRFLIAQVLPFAAVLRGLEVFHAGAVAVDGQAVALLGPSGAGKTSIAMALCGLGACFLADDVLALERNGGRLLGHPGAPLAAVAAGPGEEMVRMTPQPAAAPLEAIFLLDRRAGAPPEPCFERVTGSQALLSATFNLVLLEGSRLEALLDVCALAAGGRVERLVVDRETDASTVAAALAERIGVGS